MLDKRTQRQKHKERARVLPDLFIDPNKKGVRAAPPRATARARARAICRIYGFIAREQSAGSRYTLYSILPAKCNAENVHNGGGASEGESKSH